MKTVYILRHQAAGYITDVLFESPPTKEQVAPFAAMLARRHGIKHPKTGEVYWLRAEDISVLETGEVFEVPVPGEGASNAAGAAPMSVHGEGRVENPE